MEMRPGGKLHARILRGKDVAEDTKHVHCRKLNKRNFCPTSASRHHCVAAQAKRMETDMSVMWKDRYVVWSNDQAEARVKISRWLGNSH